MGKKCNLVSKNVRLIMWIDCIWFVDAMNICYKQVKENNAYYF